MAYIPSPRVPLSDFMLRQRMDALRRQQMEQSLAEQEGFMRNSQAVNLGGLSSVKSPLSYLGGTPYEAPMKTIGGSGKPTVGGVTQIGATRDVGGGLHAAPTQDFGFNPYASLDRIGNAKDENGNVIMAPPAGNSAPNMGSLDSFHAWQQSGMPFFGSQSNAGASKGKMGVPPVDWVANDPNAISSDPDNPETGEEAYNRIFGGLTNDYILPGRAKGGPVKKGEPIMVGERGPEVIIPKDDGEVIPNHALYSADDAARRRREALKNGDFHAYLNTMLSANVHIPSHG